MTWFRVAVLRCPLDNIIQIQSGAWVGWPMSCGGRLLRADFSLGLQQLATRSTFVVLKN